MKGGCWWALVKMALAYVVAMAAAGALFALGCWLWRVAVGV